MKIPIFPGKYHQHGEFSMAMLVYRRVMVMNPMVQIQMYEEFPFTWG